MCEVDGKCNAAVEEALVRLCDKSCLLPSPFESKLPLTTTTHGQRRNNVEVFPFEKPLEEQEKCLYRAIPMLLRSKPHWPNIECDLVFPVVNQKRLWRVFRNSPLGMLSGSPLQLLTLDFVIARLLHFPVFVP